MQPPTKPQPKPPAKSPSKPGNPSPSPKPPEPSSSSLASILRIVLVLAIVLPVGYYGLTYSDRKEAAMRKCKGIRHQILGTIGMASLSKMDSKGTKNLDFEQLIKANPLPKGMECPDGGKFTSQGDLANNGVLNCSIHGQL